MPNNDPFSLPFLNRDMLRFGQQAKFQIRVDMQADTAASLAIRGFTREGQFTFKATTPATAASIGQSTFGVPDIPIFITVEDSARVLQQGQCFVTISLLINGEVVQQLISGYVYGQKAISWPYGQNNDLRPNGGRRYSYTGTNQAAGVELSETVPAGEVWSIIAIDAVLSTSATVANRRVHLEFFDPNGGTIHVFPLTDQTAGQTLQYFWHKVGYFADELDNSEIIVPIPTEIIIGPGGVISSQTLNFQAGDNWFAPHLTIEKWFTTP